MTDDQTNDARTVALSALVWTLQDEPRAERLLALTGLTPEDLRARVNDPALLDAVLGFLEAHEPDLVACAKAIELTPFDLIAARLRLHG